MKGEAERWPNLRADYVVLATGSSYVSPIKAASDKPCSVEDRKKIIMAAHKKLASAPSVLIVGGNRRRRVGC